MMNSNKTWNISSDDSYYEITKCKYPLEID